MNNKFKMGNTPSEIVDPQKGFEEVKVLQSKTLALRKKKLLKALRLLQKAQRVAFGKLNEARHKVLHKYELNLKLRRGTMSNLTKSKRKELAEKVQSGLRNARKALEQAEEDYNAINERQEKCIEKLKGLSS